ncbi:MAG: cytochrome c-type biogenesis protein [Xanthomonadales bacterium]|jgi:cytochrome c-type biogenesis protein CcmH|nr:cytochrome c-type biogenesis protein [Xanthomonadales bacterium]
MSELHRRFPWKARRGLHRASVLAAGLALAVSLTGHALEPREFQTEAQEQRFNALTEELRCTVCQNQSLADSDVPLAEDLRDEIQTMLEQGNSDEDIKRFLVDRYGDFVLYRPPVRGNTLLLWLAPLLLLTTGAAVMAITIHRRRVMLAEEALDEAISIESADFDDADAPEQDPRS